MEKIQKPSLLTLTLLISLPTIGALFISPAIPNLVDLYSLSSSMGQFSITLYLIGFAIGELFYGPISKLYGRKKALYFGLFLALIGSILCAISSLLNNYNFLLIARFIMALGASSGYALTFTIINDFYTTEESRKILAKVAIGFAVLPWIGIFISGFIIQYITWKAIFYFFSMYILVILYLSTHLPQKETVSKNNHFHFQQTLQDYFNVLKNIRLSLFSFIVGSVVATLYIFGATAPFLAIDYMGLDSSQYGMMNLFIIFGNLLGMIAAIKLAKYIRGLPLIIYSVIFNLITVVIMILFFSSGYQNIWTLFIPSFFLFFGLALIWTNGAPLATKNISDKPHAACIMSFITISTGVIGVLIISIFKILNPIVMPLFFLGIIFFQLIVLVIAKKKKLN